MKSHITDEQYLFKKEKKRSSAANFTLTFLPPFISASLLVLVVVVFFFYPAAIPFKLSITSQLLIHDEQIVQEENCSLSVGRWVEDPEGSLYTNMSCATLPDSRNCLKNGRMDKGYLNWRWKPDGCELPRFDPKAFLEIVRGKKMAFIGDSLARNQFESLLCLLAKEEIPVDIQKDPEDRFRTWYFRYYDFTLMVLWTKFLVVSKENIVNGSNSGIFDVHLDKIDHNWAQKLPGLDYAILSVAHWFFRKNYLYEGDVRIGCIYCNDPNVTSHGPEFAIRLSFRAALNHINNCKGCDRVVTLVRTFSPGHFENGTWNDGGSCGRVGPREESKIESSGYYLEMRNMQVEEMERANKLHGRMKNNRFEVLDVTRPMIMRPDGHPGAYTGNKWMKGYNDCNHWCLPGPIDIWNDFLLAILRNKK